MAHNPVKSIKIDFHTADGVTPKPQPLPEPAATSGAATAAPEKVPAPQTTLSPLEEALFPHWATANGITDPDALDNHYDYRGIYKQTGGLVHPTGAIKGAADRFNKLQTSQHPAISSMLDMMKPVASHPPALTSPGTPSLQQAITGQVDTLKGMGDGNQEPIQQLLSLLQSSVR